MQNLSEVALDTPQRPLDEFGLPEFDDEFFADLVPLTEEELGAKFGELTELAINQPDDELAMSGLRRLVSEARDRGQIEMAMQMAMTLGAMACIHPHLENLANDMGEALGLTKEKEKSKHDSTTCANCKAGKRCPKKY